MRSIQINVYSIDDFDNAARAVAIKEYREKMHKMNTVCRLEGFAVDMLRKYGYITCTEQFVIRFGDTEIRIDAENISFNIKEVLDRLCITHPCNEDDFPKYGNFSYDNHHKMFHNCDLRGRLSGKYRNELDWVVDTVVKDFYNVIGFVVSETLKYQLELESDENVLQRIRDNDVIFFNDGTIFNKRYLCKA